jgi:dephospho-CoA kinase
MHRAVNFVVGLTGGIGSGKSAVAGCFADLGALIVDTDVIAHELTAAGGVALAPLQAVFGPGILLPSGALDRVAVRRQVFASPAARAQLEGILHPLIRAEAEAQLCRPASADFCYAVLVVPLLAETAGYRERLDRIVVVDCPESLQIERVMARNGLSRQEVMTIMAAQVDRDSRLALADDVIANVADLAQLQHQVRKLHGDYLARAQARRQVSADAAAG